MYMSIPTCEKNGYKLILIFARLEDICQFFSVDIMFISFTDDLYKVGDMIYGLFSSPQR